MTNKINNTINNIFGWRVVDGKATPPEFDFPECAWERIGFFAAEYENGLTFEGALKFVLAYDEQKCISDYNFAGINEWLPVTEEFKKWRDTGMDKSMAIAVALIYGPDKSTEESDLNAN